MYIHIIYMYIYILYILLQIPYYYPRSRKVIVDLKYYLEKYSKIKSKSNTFS